MTLVTEDGDGIKDAEDRHLIGWLYGKLLAELSRLGLSWERFDKFLRAENPEDIKRMLTNPSRKPSEIDRLAAELVLYALWGWDHEAIEGLTRRSENKA